MKNIEIAATVGVGYIGLNWFVKQALARAVHNCGAAITEPRTVSVVLATYNEERYVKRCLDSLMSQNYIAANPEYCEIIVVDSSTDGTWQILQDYVANIGSITNTPPAIRLLRDERKGKLFARDLGNRESRGEIIAAVDADRYYPCNWLNLMIGTFNAAKSKGDFLAGVCGVRIFEGIFPALLPVDGGWMTGIRNRSRTPWMDGGNSAFLRQSYIENPFDLTIDQSKLREVFREEECRFAQNLKWITKNWHAIAYCSSRRGMPWIDTSFAGEVANGDRMARLGA